MSKKKSTPVKKRSRQSSAGRPYFYELRGDGFKRFLYCRIIQMDRIWIETIDEVELQTLSLEALAEFQARCQSLIKQYGATKAKWMQ